VTPSRIQPWIQFGRFGFPLFGWTTLHDSPSQLACWLRQTCSQGKPSPLPSDSGFACTFHRRLCSTPTRDPIDTSASDETAAEARWAVALSHPSHDPAETVAALRFFADLAFEPAHRERLFPLVHHVLLCMSAHVNDEAVQSEAMRLLSFLAKHDGGCMALAAAIPATLTVLRHHTSLRLQESACLLLALLSTGGQEPRELVQAVPSMASALTAHPRAASAMLHEVCFAFERYTRTCRTAVSFVLPVVCPNAGDVHSNVDKVLSTALEGDDGRQLDADMKALHAIAAVDYLTPLCAPHICGWLPTVHAYVGLMRIMHVWV
jgi:hypothetical protein